MGFLGEVIAMRSVLAGAKGEGECAKSAGKQEFHKSMIRQKAHSATD